VHERGTEAAWGLGAGLGTDLAGGSAEANVRDAEGNLVALGTGAFRVFVKEGNAIVKGKELDEHPGSLPPRR
jgi:hypothetical protein